MVDRANILDVLGRMPFKSRTTLALSPDLYRVLSSDSKWKRVKYRLFATSIEIDPALPPMGCELRCRAQAQA